MIPYELAHQLKQAGFPKDWILEYDGTLRDCTANTRISLSKLIEACGEGFLELTGHIVDPEGSKFMATPFPLDYSRSTFGLTPEIAVAQLYLALNPKNI